LNGLAALSVGFVAQFIIQSYTKSLLGDLRGLYARRESQCAGDDPSRKLLVRRRSELDRLRSGYEGG
jgi:hypothetical protein